MAILDGEEVWYDPTGYEVKIIEVNGDTVKYKYTEDNEAFTEEINEFRASFQKQKP